MSGSSYSGFARGWFVVALSDEIHPGVVCSMRYFARDLIAFRGDDGQVRVLDAHCPHLGAHLGVGGRVIGDTIECPFHGWRFDGAGHCQHIPYGKGKIPPRATTRSWPVAERNGLIFVFHGRDRRPPDYDIPVLAEFGAPDWTPWQSKCLTIATQPREIVENVADKAHFPRVHRTDIEHFENVYDGHCATQISHGLARPVGGGVDRFKLEATYYGPGYQITRMDGVLKNRLLLAHTPIDERSLHLRFGVMLKVLGDAERTAGFAAKYIQNLQAGFEEDIAIWENKCWRDQPALNDGDGPIGRLRKWYRQFYTDPEAMIESV